MRSSTVFVSSAFVFASTSAAFPRESGNIMAARFADSNFLTEVDARAYDEDAQGGTISIENHKSLSATSRYYRSEHDNDPVARGYVLSRDGSVGIPPYPSHYRRSFYEPPRYELTRRHRWDYAGNRHIPNGRPGTSSSESSPPTTPGISRPTTPGFSTPPTPGTPSSRASTPVSNWRGMPSTPYSAVLNGWGGHQVPSTPPTPGSPGSSRPSTPEWRRVPSTPGSSRPSTPGTPSVPSTPGSSRPSSPEWRHVPNGRSHYRRSFYYLD